MKIDKTLIKLIIVLLTVFITTISQAANICMNESLPGYFEAEENYTEWNPPRDQRYRMRERTDTDAYGGSTLQTYSDGSGSGTFWYYWSVNASENYYIWARAKGKDSSNNQLQFWSNNNVYYTRTFSTSEYEWVQINTTALSTSVNQIWVGAVNNDAEVHLDGFYVTTDPDDTPIDNCTSGSDPSADPETGLCGEIPLYTQNLTYPAIMVELDVSGSMAYNMLENDADGYEYFSNDISDMIQEMVNLDTWVSGDNIAFRVTGSFVTRWVDTYDSSNSEPRLVISYLDSSSTEQTITVDISSSDDDVSYNGTSITRTSYSIALGPTSSGGFLFRNIAIPKDSKIVEAKLKFDIYDEGDDNSPSRLVIRALNDSKKTSFVASDFALNNYNVTESSAFLNLTRLDYAVTTLEEVFTDDAIAWGFSTWTGDNSSTDNYTEFKVGIKDHNSSHFSNLYTALYDTYADGGTPLTPALKASEDYFDGDRFDETYKEKYTGAYCQPKILVVVTDGVGNVATTSSYTSGYWDSWGDATTSVLDSDVSVVAVGFSDGLDDDYQLARIAQLAQKKGLISDADTLYALHNEEPREVDNTYSDSDSIIAVEGAVSADASVQTIGVPFLAQSPKEFLDAMNSIVSSVKIQQYHGVAPAPTTSTEDGDFLVTATFNPGKWVGDLVVNKLDPDTGQLSDVAWKASEVFTHNGGIDDDNCYMYDSSSGSVSLYDDSSLDSDNYLCKELGDIINSTPRIVPLPPYFYTFDDYLDFKYDTDILSRDSLVYVAANDGALHAFLLDHGTKWDEVAEVDRPALGTEMWRFYPDSVEGRLNQDMCSDDWCHEYINDGSPQVADIFNGSAWKTILTAGIGKGGDGFYALDITYGEDMSHSTKGSSVLWEFTSADDAFVGKATAVPEIDRIDKKMDGSVVTAGSTWVTIFGSGTAIDPTDQLSKNAYIFAVNSWNKDKVWKDETDTFVSKIKIGTTDPNDSSKILTNDIPSSPLVLDYDDDRKSDRIYVGNRYGDLFRIKNISVGDTPVTQTLFNSENVQHTTPVTGKPAFAYGQNDDIWIYFGTGKYDETSDRSTTEQQYLFALLDEDANRATSYDKDDLRECSLGSITDSDGEVYRSVNCEQGTGPWMLNLYSDSSGVNPSERITTQPLVIGGVVFFVTYIPGTDACGEAGESFMFALDWETGDVVEPDVFPGVKDEVNGVSVVGFSLGAGVANQPVHHGDKLYVTTTHETPLAVPINLEDLKIKLKSWKQEYN